MTKTNSKPSGARAAAPDASAATTPAAQDFPMSGIENDPASIFQPGAGIGSLDYLEISVAFFLELSGSPVRVEKGALRSLGMSASRVAQLSDSAQRFMRPLIPPHQAN